jgi:hypothetical protein
MNGIARYEGQRAGAADRGLAVDRQFVKTIDDKENFLLIEMHMVGWAFAGLVPCHDNGPGAAMASTANSRLELLLVASDPSHFRRRYARIVHKDADHPGSP